MKELEIQNGASAGNAISCRQAKASCCMKYLHV